MQTFDIIVIGAGIAGVSVAAHLAKNKEVAVLEMEERPGYHATGRSAASYEPNYGPPPILAFTRASYNFFEQPPRGFADAPLMVLRDSLFLMPEGQEKDAEKLLALGSNLAEISVRAARESFPVLRENYAKRVFLDPFTGDLDVDLIHRGYLRVFKDRGGTLILSAPAKGLLQRDGRWSVATQQGVFSAPIVVNAAGAWGDTIAKLGGVRPVGLVPKRRSIGVIPIAGHADLMDWAMAIDVGETWYARPQSGKLLISSADATPVEPHDAFADDMAIAEAVDRVTTATTLEVVRPDHTWGGLRTFAPDGNPVVGFDPHAEGFFWLAGQGGYGIQSCPALSKTAAALILDEDLPAMMAEHPVELSLISPKRFHQ